MIKIDDLVKTIRTKGSAEIKEAGSQDEEKRSKELLKEIDENKKAMESLKEKEAEKEAAKSEFVEHTTKPMKEYSVEPVTNPNIECPFCGKEKRPKGMGRHIAAIHEIEGVSIEDLESVEKGEKNLKDLVIEKHKGKGEPEVYGLSDDVKKREFADWTDIEPEENLEEGPEDKKIIDNPGPPGDPSCYENPGNPDEKNPEDKKNPRERRRLNLMPPFSPFERRRSRI